MITRSENIILDGTLVSRLVVDIQNIFNVIEIETPPKAAQGTIIFVGELLMSDSEAAYDLIAERWKRHDYTPMLKQYRQKIGLTAQPGVVIAQPSNPWINLILGIITLISVLFTGAMYESKSGDLPTTLAAWASGLPMMFAMMSILTAHEFGHYFAARYHKVAATLPYFIPLPAPISPVGTLGAFIQLRSPFKTKKQLFDIGVAGPLGGLIFALPLIIWGVLNAPIQQLTHEGNSMLEGNSIFYLGIKYFIHGQLLPSFNQYADLSTLKEFSLLLMGIVPSGGGTDIMINSFTLAAWFGLFVTAMNLLPVGQLDGGHLAYCLLGNKSRWLGLTLVSIMVLAGIFTWSGWLLWSILVFFVVGVGHPAPLNDLAPLGTARKILAYVMIIVFIILFMPMPLQLF